jgi:hypothetical protein
MITSQRWTPSFPRTRRRPPAPTQIVAVDCPGTTLAAAPCSSKRVKLVCRRGAKASPPRPPLLLRPRNEHLTRQAPASRPPAVARLAAIAEDQWGLLTRQHAQAAGIARATLRTPDRRVDSRTRGLRRVSPRRSTHSRPHAAAGGVAATRARRSPLATDPPARGGLAPLRRVHVRRLATFPPIAMSSPSPRDASRGARTSDSTSGPGAQESGSSFGACPSRDHPGSPPISSSTTKIPRPSPTSSRTRSARCTTTQAPSPRHSVPMPPALAYDGATASRSSSGSWGSSGTRTQISG